MVSESTVISHGGTHLKASDLNISHWEDSIESNLVAIDRRGRLIFDLITPRTLPELSETMALRLAGVIKAAVERYYAANTVVGCLDPTSSSYDMDANVAADQCDDPLGNGDDPAAENKRMPLGGVYETCSGSDELCAGRPSLNPATGKAECPYGYMAVQLLEPQVRVCSNKCQHNLFWAPNCKQECAVTTAYWCAINPQLENSTGGSDLGFLFGGLFTDATTNPVTNAMSCPLYYDAYPLGRRLRVCLSSDKEMGRRYSLPFGGFYACQSGNPLVDALSGDPAASKRVRIERKLRRMDLWMTGRGSPDIFQAAWPKRCPTGYTSHLAVIEDICQVNYCTPANSIKVIQERRLKRPPFIQLAGMFALPWNIRKTTDRREVSIDHSESASSGIHIGYHHQRLRPPPPPPSSMTSSDEAKNKFYEALHALLDRRRANCLSLATSTPTPGQSTLPRRNCWVPTISTTVALTASVLGEPARPPDQHLRLSSEAVEGNVDARLIPALAAASLHSPLQARSTGWIGDQGDLWGQLLTDRCLFI
ncbi:unnamed protein product [Schistocephalus solidus]|uniref:WSC domain-containing protein n=1 Tax=Schistocephalus solidus TaxID=70667 RepID=A0A183T541_SCHSO|nr:unnamed protein product [Schistocephalus solidus]